MSEEYRITDNPRNEKQHKIDRMIVRAIGDSIGKEIEGSIPKTDMEKIRLGTEIADWTDMVHRIHAMKNRHDVVDDKARVICIEIMRLLDQYHMIAIAPSVAAYLDSDREEPQ